MYSLEEELRWSSHLPALLACVAATKGDVLEIGMGWFSTPILHSAVCGAGRMLVSLEKDKAWRDKFADYNKPVHTIYEQVDYDKDPPCPFGFMRWSVVFIDDSPGPDRWKHVKRFLPVAEYLVVHDAGPEPGTIDPIMPLLSGCFWMIHKRFTPWTLVVSKLGVSIP